MVDLTQTATSEDWLASSSDLRLIAYVEAASAWEKPAISIDPGVVPTSQDEWEVQIKTDSDAGAFDSLVDEALAEDGEGLTRDL